MYTHIHKCMYDKITRNGMSVSTGINILNFDRYYQTAFLSNTANTCPPTLLESILSNTWKY